MRFRRVTPILRPPRLAIGIAPTSFVGQWTGVLANVSATWGGFLSTTYFPLDQWGRGTIWDTLLDVFDADAYIFGGAFADQTSIEDRYGPIDATTDPSIHMGPGPLSWHTTSLAAVLRLAVPQKPSQARMVRILNAPSWFGLAVIRQRGILVDQDVLDIAKAGVDIEVDEFDLNDSAQLAAAVNAATRPAPGTVAELGRVGLMTLSPITSTPWQPIVVCGSAVADIALWLAIRAYRNPNDVYWVPTEAVDTIHKDSISNRYARGIGAAIRDLSSAPNRQRLLLTSQSLQPVALTAVGDTIRQYIPPQPTVELVTDIRPHLGPRAFAAITRHEGAYIDQFTEGRSHSMVRLSWPDWMARSPDFNVNFLAELQVERYGALNHRAAIPYFADQLAGLRERGGRYGIVGDFRSPIHQMGDELHHILLLRQFDLPSALVLAERLANHLGGTVTLSDAGRLHRELVGRFKDIRHAAQSLAATPLAEVLAEYLLPVNNQNKRSGRIEAEGRWVIGSRLFADILNGLPESPEAYLRRWTEQRPIEWGLVLQCEHCRHTGFYRWPEMGQYAAVCKRCGRSYLISAPSAGNWVPVARLDELVLQALQRDAIEELCLAELSAKNAEKWEAVVGLEWRLPDLIVETDLLAVIDGDLVLGEAKSTGEIGDTTQVQRLSQLAARLEARRLVFGTSGTAWQPGVLSRFQRAQAEHPGVNVSVYAELRSPTGPSVVQL